MSNFYVDNSYGDDGNSGTSEGAGGAWETLQRAALVSATEPKVWVKNTGIPYVVESPVDTWGVVVGKHWWSGYTDTIGDDGVVEIQAGSGLAEDDGVFEWQCNSSHPYWLFRNMLLSDALATRLAFHRIGYNDPCLIQFHNVEVSGFKTGWDCYEVCGTDITGLYGFYQWLRCKASDCRVGIIIGDPERTSHAAVIDSDFVRCGSTRNPAAGTEWDDSAITLWCGCNLVVGNRLLDCTGYGIRWDYHANGAILRNTLLGCGVGVDFWTQYTDVAQSCLIGSNIFSGCEYALKGQHASNLSFRPSGTRQAIANTFWNNTHDSDSGAVDYTVNFQTDPDMATDGTLPYESSSRKSGQIHPAWATREMPAGADISTVAPSLASGSTVDVAIQTWLDARLADGTLPASYRDKVPPNVAPDYLVWEILSDDVDRSMSDKARVALIRFTVRTDDDSPQTLDGWTRYIETNLTESALSADLEYINYVVSQRRSLDKDPETGHLVGVLEVELMAQEK